MGDGKADSGTPGPEQWPVHRFPQIPPLWRVALLSAFTSIGALLFGIDLGSIGGQTTMEYFTHDIGELTEMMRGVLVASILISSSISGVLAGRLADVLSRRLALALAFGIYAIGTAICAGSLNLAMLASGRVFAGVGEGIFLACAVTYVIAEISPKKYRGRMSSVFQCMWGGGVPIGYFICYGSVKISSTISWRLSFIIQSIIAAAATVAAPFIPESPRWLLLKGRKAEAEKILDRLTGTSEAELAERHELLSFGAKGADTKSSSFMAIFHKDVRRRTFLGVFVQVLQMLSGIDAVLYYAPSIFVSAGLDKETASFIASGVTGIVGFVTNACVPLYIDRVGRRSLFVAGGLCIAATQLTLGSIFASGANTAPAAKWAIIILIELFVVSVAFSWSTVTRLYASEIQPTHTRASSIAFGSAANQLTNTLVALTTPVFLEHSNFGMYFLYGGASLIGAVVGLLFMPETKGKSLEAIDAHFHATVSQPPPIVDVLHHRRPHLPSVQSMDALGAFFLAQKKEAQAEKDEVPVSPWEDKRYSCYSPRVETPPTTPTSPVDTAVEKAVEELFVKLTQPKKPSFGSRVESPTYSRGTSEVGSDTYSSYGGRTAH